MSTSTSILLAVLATGVAGEPLNQQSEADMSTRIARLCTVAWDSPPEGQDVLLYRERKLRQQSRDEIENAMEQVFREADRGGHDSKLSREALIELNVSNIMNEQREWRRLVQRIRQDGDQERMDMAILDAGQTVSDAKLANSYITLGERVTPEGYNAFQIDGEARIVMILPAGRRFGGTPLTDWLHPPFRLLMKGLFGAADDDSGRSVLDEGRIQSFLDGEEGVQLTLRVVSVEDGAATPRERFEFIDSVSGKVIVTFVVDISDYARVYEYQVNNGISGMPILTQRRSGYLPNSVPTIIESELYDESGAVIERDNVYFLKVDQIACSDVFAFPAPDGYGLVDTRTSPGHVIRTPDHAFVVRGDAVSDIVRIPTGILVKENLERVGLAVPGSD